MKHNRADWEDRPKQHRPTKEQLKKAAYRLADTERDGIKHAINLESTPLRRALKRKKLTARQVEAGERFEELYVSAFGRSGSRDSLDLSPRAGIAHESDGQALFVANQKKRLADLQFSMDAPTALVMLQVCVYLEQIGDCRPSYVRYSRLVAGLDIAADYFENGKKRKM